LIVRCDDDKDGEDVLLLVLPELGQLLDCMTFVLAPLGCTTVAQLLVWITLVSVGILLGGGGGTRVLVVVVVEEEELGG
jgi:hypothetical protein